MKAKLFFGAILLTALIGCGKNDPYAYYPYNSPIAPAPNGSPQYIPSQDWPIYGGTPYGYQQQPYGYPQQPYGTPYQGYNTSPYGYQMPGAQYPGAFYPQLPQGMPQSYSPFLPVDYYYRNNPSYGPQYWNQIWSGWQNQARNWNVSPYDFPTFWTQYCPRVMQGQNYQTYNYLNQTFYYWVNPQTQINVSTQPGSFWQYYIGLVY